VTDSSGKTNPKQSSSQQSLKPNNESKNENQVQKNKNEVNSGCDKISNAQGALSLFEFDNQTGDNYTSSSVPGGYYIKPKENAYGHKSFIIKSHGNLYDTDGTTLIKTYGDMASLKDANRPEYGWHGY
jgi:hypothetical protein